MGKGCIWPLCMWIRFGSSAKCIVIRRTTGGNELPPRTIAKSSVSPRQILPEGYGFCTEESMACGAAGESINLGYRSCVIMSVVSALSLRLCLSQLSSVPVSHSMVPDGR